MKIIKKHPVAFWVMIGLVLTGLAGILIVHDGDHSQLYMGLSALMFMAGIAIAVLAIVIGIISKLISLRQTKNDDRPEGWYEAELAREYMYKSGFNAVYWIIIILLTPIVPVLLVHVLNYYMLGVLLLTLGLMIFMVAANGDVLEKRFFRKRNTGSHFRVQSGEDKALVDLLYGDYVHAYLKHNWDEHSQDFIYNLLRRETGLSGDVRCYTVSSDYLSEHYGCYRSPLIEGYVLVPFSQFELNPKNGQRLRQFFDRLSSTTFTSLLNARYGSKSSLLPEDYAHSAQGILLRPSAADISGVGRSGPDIHIALSNARETNDPYKRYYDCLLVLKNAQLAGDAEMAQIEARLFSSDTRYISGFALDEDQHTLTLTVIIDDDIEAESWDQDPEEYAPEHQLVYNCGRLEWYYDGFCDAGKTAAVLERINPVKNQSE